MTRVVNPVRQVKVTDHPSTGHRYDYADSFEVQLPEPEVQPPENWVRAGMNDSSAVVEWISDRLGMSERSGHAAGRVDDGRVIRSTNDVVEIEWSVPLMRVIVVGRRIEPSGRRLTSFLYYQRPALARLVWAVVGIGHRRMARRLIASNVSRSTDATDQDFPRPR